MPGADHDSTDIHAHGLTTIDHRPIVSVPPQAVRTTLAVHTSVTQFGYRAGMRILTVAVVAIGLALTSCAGSPATSIRPSDTQALRMLPLRDVRTGAEFTVGQLVADGPVLLEPMAIWCTNCRGQQHQVVDAHGLADFASISLDVDPNERPDDLAAYADREGFDWRFAVADADLAQLLRDQFGSAVLNPPSMPKILFRTDGSVELIGLGEQLTALELAAILGG